MRWWVIAVAVPSSNNTIKTGACHWIPHVILLGSLGSRSDGVASQVRMNRDLSSGTLLTGGFSPAGYSSWSVEPAANGGQHRRRSLGLAGTTDREKGSQNNPEAEHRGTERDTSPALVFCQSHTAEHTLDVDTHVRSTPRCGHHGRDGAPHERSPEFLYPACVGTHQP